MNLGAVGNQLEIGDVREVLRVMRDKYCTVTSCRGGNPGVAAFDWPSLPAAKFRDLRPVLGHRRIVSKDYEPT